MKFWVITGVSTYTPKGDGLNPHFWVKIIYNLLILRRAKNLIMDFTNPLIL